MRARRSRPAAAHLRPLEVSCHLGDPQARVLGGMRELGVRVRTAWKEARLAGIELESVDASLLLKLAQLCQKPADGFRIRQVERGYRLRSPPPKHAIFEVLEQVHGELERRSGERDSKLEFLARRRRAVAGDVVAECGTLAVRFTRSLGERRNPERHLESEVVQLVHHLLGCWKLAGAEVYVSVPLLPPIVNLHGRSRQATLCNLPRVRHHGVLRDTAVVARPRAPDWVLHNLIGRRSSRAWHWRECARRRLPNVGRHRQADAQTGGAIVVSRCDATPRVHDTVVFPPKSALEAKHAISGILRDVAER
mmetsp:Transcript_6206/g.16064  ORF Transcript_6206/g.16064 Transcript_6206/m.16064 type:complete len:308 (-) Transcript_6206:1216-2139(-)